MGTLAADDDLEESNLGMAFWDTQLREILGAILHSETLVVGILYRTLIPGRQRDIFPLPPPLEWNFGDTGGVSEATVFLMLTGCIVALNACLPAF